MHNSRKSSKEKRVFDHGPKRENIIHCQLRNKASNINAHLNEDFLIEDSSCQYCGNSYEDAEHYFLSCSKYAIQREIM